MLFLYRQMRTETETDIHQIMHTVQRLRERYSLDILPSDYKKACEDVQSGRAVWLYRSDTTHTVWLVLIKACAIPVVLNEKTGNIITALPRSALRNDECTPALSSLVGRAAISHAA